MRDYVGTCDEAAELLALSAQFRNPLLCHVTPCDTTKFTGGRPAVQDTKITELFYKVDKYANKRIPAESVLSVSNPLLLVTAFKRAEDNSAWIVRIFNATDKQQDAVLNTIGDIHSSDMNEEIFDVLGTNEAKIILRPKEISTFYIR